MAEALAEAARVVDAGADPSELLRDLYADLHDVAVARARGEAGEPGVEWCLAAAELVARHQRLARESRSARATLDLALLALARLGDVADLEQLVSRLEALERGGAGPRAEPEPRRAMPPSPAAPSPAAAPRPPARAEDRPRFGAEPLSGAELSRIRSHPRVREVLATFGGHIENVRRKEDG
jgi:hypothetical protein